MPNIPRNIENKNEIFNSVAIFLKEFQIGKLLSQYNAGKMKEIPVMDIFRYLLCLISLTEVCPCREKRGVF